MFVSVIDLLLAAMPMVMGDSGPGSGQPPHTWLPNNRQFSLRSVRGYDPGRCLGADSFPHFRPVDGKAFFGLKAQNDSGAADLEYRDFHHGLGLIETAYDD
jgi:hypothetical protein